MSFVRDLKGAAVSLARTPGFTLIALLTLAFGIGATTAIFSVVNGVLLRPLPYPAADRLVSIRERIPQLKQYPSFPVNEKHYLAWLKARSFDDMTIFQPYLAGLTGRGTAEMVACVSASASMFSTLGIRPRLGRIFTVAEQQKGHDAVALISTEFWQRKFGGAPDVLGKTIVLAGHLDTVIGVLPAGFRFPEGDFDISERAGSQPEVYTPFVFEKDQLDDMGDFNFDVIARLRPGVKPAQAAAELDVTEADFVRRAGPDATGIQLYATLESLQEAIVGPVRRGLLLILFAVLAVLLIAAVNLANLMLVRATARSREAAVRAAMGADRRRLLQVPLAEVTLLCGAGTLLGVLLAWGGTRALVAAAPLDLPRAANISLDGHVLGFAVLIACVSGLLFGLGPALRFSRADPQEALRAASTRASEGRGARQLRESLVALEATLTAALLVVTGLLLTSFTRVMRVNPGYAASNLLTARLSLPATTYSDDQRTVGFYDNLLGRVRALPGVLSASLISALPLEGETWIDIVTLPGDNRPVFLKPAANMRFVAPGYFTTMKTPLLAGRDFSESDRNQKVCILSAAAARRIFHGARAVGELVAHNDREKFLVVGVAGDVRTSLESGPVVMVYLPYWQRPRDASYLVVRTAASPGALAPSLRQAVWSVDPDVPVWRINTMDQIAAASESRRRFQVQLATAFGISALLLAMLGIYGVVAYSVTRRTTEIGIRSALGAAPGSLRALVVRQGIAPVLVGSVLGLLAALALSRLLANMLFGIRATDPWIYAAVGLLLVLTGVLACLLPALRASRVNPVQALRYE
jgi:predicted permease